LRNAGFDLRGKAGKNGKRGRDKCSYRDCGKCLDHDGPLSWTFAARRFVRLIDIQRPFRDVFAEAENGFFPPEFCFVAVSGKKHGRLA
jgi:hypothetical protein